MRFDKLLTVSFCAFHAVIGARQDARVCVAAFFFQWPQKKFPSSVREEGAARRREISQGSPRSRTTARRNAESSPLARGGATKR